MQFNREHTQVLIVGAGPSGLMMAAQLVRLGVHPVIIDSKLGPTDESKALAVQARSLEIYRQMGIANGVIKNGKQAEEVVFNENGKPAANFVMENMGEEETPFPYILLYPQSRNERALLDYLTWNTCPVYWGTTLTSLKQDPKGAEVTLQTDKQTSTARCNWLIGADGAHSFVRKQLQIPFNGDTYSHNFYLADVTLRDHGLGEKQINLFLVRKGFSAFFPMPEAKRYRMIGNLPETLENKKELAINDVLPGIEKITGRNIAIEKTHWFTRYRLHHRMAERFRAERCFLIGDAAHIHSPVGGQGMNTGLQDAYNLAWKLAGVIKGQLDKKILESYAAERIPVAKKLLKTTDRMFSLVLSDNWLIALIKRWVMPYLLKMAWGNKNLRTVFFRQVSQIAINYRDSPLSLHVSQAGSIRAGDRLPFFRVFDEKRNEETDLHEWCSKPGFTFIAMGRLTESDLFALAKWITQKYAGMLNFFYLPPSAKNQNVFDAFEVNEKTGKSVIVRPDMHIGFLNDRIDMKLMDNYLINVADVQV
ncbi:MAG TPA: FAD-dependent monooxygenase [Mucilaginibacter sp.]|nr:FAD-dependent monooxygenase [Mucilaginibacter sp.]